MSKTSNLKNIYINDINNKYNSVTKDRDASAANTSGY